MINIESIRQTADRIFSGLVFAMAVTFFIVSFSLPESSALLPRLVALFTAVLDLPVIIEIWRKKNSPSNEKVVVPMYWSVLVLLVYYLVLMFLGYIVASLALVVVISRMMGQKNWIAIIALAVIMTGSTYYIFGTFFGVVLPKGLLFNMLF